MTDQRTREALRQLVEWWRKRAAGLGGTSQRISRSLGMCDCADELEALLASLPVRPEQGVSHHPDCDDGACHPQCPAAVAAPQEAP